LPSELSGRERYQTREIDSFRGPKVCSISCDTANLDELKDELGKTRVSEGVGQAILRGETAPHLQAPAPRKPAHRQMKDELAIVISH
jgi:hypothetical protein